MRPACFPEYLALVNPLAGQAFVMGFVEEKTFLAESVISVSSGYENFVGPRDWSPRKPRTDRILGPCPPCPTQDAFLIVRPYVKVLDKAPALEGAKLSFTMDADPVIERDPLMDYVVKEKYDNLKPVSRKWEGIFFAASIDEQNQANAAQTYGVMAVNCTRLEVYLHRMDPQGDPVRIECGFIAALYTSKDVKK